MEVLVEKTITCAKNHQLSQVVLSGGVAANSLLRRRLKEACQKEGFSFYVPELYLCTDNAAMIACAGYYDYCLGHRSSWDLNAASSVPIGLRP